MPPLYASGQRRSTRGSTSALYPVLALWQVVLTEGQTEGAVLPGQLGEPLALGLGDHPAFPGLDQQGDLVEQVQAEDQRPLLIPALVDGQAGQLPQGGDHL